MLTMTLDNETLEKIVCRELTWRDALGFTDHDRELWADLAHDSLLIGELEEARTIFEGLTVLDPDWYGGWAGLAAVAIRAGNPESAELCLGHALARGAVQQDRSVLALRDSIELAKAQLREKTNNVPAFDNPAEGDTQCGQQL
jgi:hypothetical protein